MERMTIQRSDGRFSIANNNGSSPIQQTMKIPFVIDRLGAIEDIMGDDYDLDRLRELVEADRDGRCIVTPYRLPRNSLIEHDEVMLYKKGLDGKIDEIEVCTLSVMSDGTCWFEPCGEGHDGVVYDSKDMGISIFTERR